MSVEFLLTSLVVVIMPGTGVIYTLAVSLGRGLRPGIAAAFGCTLGIVPAAFASIVGLAAIFHTSALAFQVVKVLGVLWLVYMAWSVLRSGGAFEVDEDRSPRGLVRTAVDGTLLNVLNPKLSLFFLAFLPQFVATDAAGATGTMVVLAAVFMVITFVVFVGYAALAAVARDHVVSRPGVVAWLKRSFATAFGLLAVRLAVAER